MRRNWEKRISHRCLLSKPMLFSLLRFFFMQATNRENMKIFALSFFSHCVWNRNCERWKSILSACKIKLSLQLKSHFYLTMHQVLSKSKFSSPNLRIARNSIKTSKREKWIEQFRVKYTRRHWRSIFTTYSMSLICSARQVAYLWIHRMHHYYPIYSSYLASIDAARSLSLDIDIRQEDTFILVRHWNLGSSSR